RSGGPAALVVRQGERSPLDAPPVGPVEQAWGRRPLEAGSPCASEDNPEGGSRIGARSDRGDPQKDPEPVSAVRTFAPGAPGTGRGHRVLAVSDHRVSTVRQLQLVATR